MFSFQLKLNMLQRFALIAFSNGNRFPLFPKMLK